MINRSTIMILTFASMMLTVSPINAKEPYTRIDAAIDSPFRTERDRSLDESRQPGKFLQFLAVKNGDKVAEINAGPGYNARLLATIVGNEGRVYASNADFVLKLFSGLNERLEDSVVNIYNIQVSRQANSQLDHPEILDMAILNNNYHDLHWQKIDVLAFNQAVFNALRPGGYFVVGDHKAKQGSGTRDVATLHRIDADTVISEIEAAGFVLESSASFLSNAKDDLTLPAFDPSVRGRTDRFLLKFKKVER